MVGRRHRSIVDVMTVTTRTPNIFDISWPIFAYQDATDPDEAHAIIRQAHLQAPIALGPYGPEVLGYDLVRTVLRDSRFAMPRGISLVVQGITSGPVWDKVCQTIMSVDAAQHHRLRRLVSRAFTPRAAQRMRTACVDVINELIDRHSAAGRCDMVHDIARQYPVAIICALVGAPREDWQLFSRWADDLSKAFGANVAADEPAILRAWEQLDAYLEGIDRPASPHAQRRPDLRAHPRRRGRRPAHPRRTGQPRRHPAQRRHRHHPQPVGRRRASVIRSSRPVGIARRTSRARAASGRRAHAPLARSSSPHFASPLRTSNSAAFSSRRAPT